METIDRAQSTLLGSFEKGGIDLTPAHMNVPELSGKIF
jgi:hypothetical protein